jgi:hypothetical protein
MLRHLLQEFVLTFEGACSTYKWHPMLFTHMFLHIKGIRNFILDMPKKSEFSDVLRGFVEKCQV